MRAMSMAVVAAILACGLSGCGGGSAKAETLTQQLIDEFNKMGDNLEKGDKAAIKANIAKLTSLAKEGKELKLPKEQDKALEEKYAPKLKEAQEHMTQGMMKATTSGKLTPDDMAELMKDMQSIGPGMQK